MCANQPAWVVQVQAMPCSGNVLDTSSGNAMACIHEFVENLQLAWQSLNKASCHPNHDFFTTMYKKCGMAAEARSPPGPTFNSKCDDLNSLMIDFSRAVLPRDDSNIHKAIAKKPLDR